MCAALAVMASHAFLITGGQDALQPFQRTLHGITLGTLAVYGFFAMSGFLLCRSFQTQPDMRRYVLHRAARILPALALVTVFTVGLGAILTTSPAAFWKAVPSFAAKNLVLAGQEQTLPGVFLSNPYGPTLNAALWSLPYEAGCYAGLLIAGVTGLLWRRRVMLALALVPLTLLVLVTFRIFLGSRPDGLGALDLFVRYGVFFLCGSLLWSWRERVPLHPGITIALWLGVAFGVVTIVFFHVLLTIAVTYTVIWLAHLRAPVLTPFNRLGDYSYATYLFGFPIQQLVQHFTGPASPLLNLTIAFPLTLCAAVFSWHLIERPSLAAVRRDP